MEFLISFTDVRVCEYVGGGGEGGEDYFFYRCRRCSRRLSTTNAISALVKRPKKGFKLDIHFASYEYNYLELCHAISDKKLTI